MKYKYKVILGNVLNVERELNALGKQGWKVVAASWDSDASEHVVYLMREI